MSSFCAGLASPRQPMCGCGVYLPYLRRTGSIPAMTIIVDTHTHLYSCYEWRAALGSLLSNLERLVPGATPVAFVAERSGQNLLEGLIRGTLSFPDTVLRAVTTSGAIELTTQTGSSILLLPARQIATAEGLEILALGTNYPIPDGRPTTVTIGSILDRGEVPVLAWSAGKWLFRRGRVIHEVLQQFGPQQLYLGDTTLRPQAWAYPPLMRMALGRGFKILAGSDPLPHSGEERFLGRYATLLDGEFDRDDPAGSFRSLLAKTTPCAKGRRCNFMTIVLRLVRYFLSRGL
ncbi:MAG: hypothetical protein ACUVWX_04315 [Kiritimatiellia bacterium]